MEDTSGLFPKDIHSFLRTFIPGSIFVIVFLCVVSLPTIKVGFSEQQLKNISGGLILGLIAISYIFGNIIAWISHVFLHRWCQRFTYIDSLMGYKLLNEEVRELNKILKEEKGLTRAEWYHNIFGTRRLFVRTTQRRRMALLFDYFLHNEENNMNVKMKNHRERIFFIMSRVHAIYASIIGIILGIVIGWFWLWYRDGCLNKVPWAIVILWALIAIVIYFFYRILRNNVIAYEKIFIWVNRNELKDLNDRLHGRG